MGDAVRRSLFDDEDETAQSSEYMPSSSSASSSADDGETDAEIVSAEELLQDDRSPAMDQDDDVQFEPQDKRYWKSIQEKKAWIAQFKEADLRYVKQLGARMATSSDLKAKKQLRRQAQWHSVYYLVLTVLVVVYLAAILYQKKPLIPLIAWRNGTLGNGNQSTVRHPTGSEFVLIEHLEIQSPADDGSLAHLDVDHLQTGLVLCSKLVFRLVAAKHDPIVKRSAVEACDAVVALAPRGSLESAKAHVLRGDLRSLESEFDAADQDYEQAESTAKSSFPGAALLENVQHKRLANRWIHLYTIKKLNELQKECEDVVAASEAASLVRRLAGDWIQVFKQQKELMDVLTNSRFVTLQRLVYQ